MALAAIAAGKHVHCEKPIAPHAEDARAMMEAAEAKGVRTQVGYNYLKNPLLALARDMIAAGELGEIIGFRGIHAEDYMLDPEIPWYWRVDPRGGSGAVADLGSHIVGMARFLLGPIAQLTADLETVVKDRPVAAGASERRPVEVDDIARLTVRFARGCGGTIEANWMATGRKMQLGFEISGRKGSLVFSQERFNELLFYRVGGRSAPCRLPAHRGRAAASPLWPVLRRPRPSAGVQRSEDHGGRRFPGSHRGRAGQGPGFPRGLGDPEGHRRRASLGPRAPLGPGRLAW